MKGERHYAKAEFFALPRMLLPMRMKSVVGGPRGGGMLHAVIFETHLKMHGCMAQSSHMASIIVKTDRIALGAGMQARWRDSYVAEHVLSRKGSLDTRCVNVFLCFSSTEAVSIVELNR